jgi:hypothetical protein
MPHQLQTEEDFVRLVSILLLSTLARFTFVCRHARLTMFWISKLALSNLWPRRPGLTALEEANRCPFMNNTWFCGAVCAAYYRLRHVMDNPIMKFVFQHPDGVLTSVTRQLPMTKPSNNKFKGFWCVLRAAWTNIWCRFSFNHLIIITTVSHSWWYDRLRIIWFSCPAAATSATTPIRLRVPSTYPRWLRITMQSRQLKPNCQTAVHAT